MVNLIFLPHLKPSMASRVGPVHLSTWRSSHAKKEGRPLVIIISSTLGIALQFRLRDGADLETPSNLPSKFRGKSAPQKGIGTSDPIKTQLCPRNYTSLCLCGEPEISLGRILVLESGKGILFNGSIFLPFFFFKLNISSVLNPQSGPFLVQPISGRRKKNRSR